MDKEVKRPKRRKRLHAVPQTPAPSPTVEEQIAAIERRIEELRQELMPTLLHRHQRLIDLWREVGELAPPIVRDDRDSEEWAAVRTIRLALRRLLEANTQKLRTVEQSPTPPAA